MFKRLKKMGKKKMFVLVGAVAVAAVFLVIAVSGGGGGKDLHARALANIAEARFFMKQATSDDLRVQFFSGIREKNYAMDGVADTNVPFALLNVEPRGINLIDAQEIRGTLKLGEESEEVVLERNEFGRNFAVDLGKLVEAGTEVVFTLFAGTDDEVEFPLTQSMPDDAIGWEQALQVGTTHFSEQLTAQNVKSFESYVKIITDRESLGAFWFVQFITSDGQTLFVVIGTDGSIISNPPRG